MDRDEIAKLLTDAGHAINANNGHCALVEGVLCRVTSLCTDLLREIDAKKVKDSLCLLETARLVYPILLAVEAGEIGESKAAELLGKDIVSVREIRHQTIRAVMQLVESLPSPLILLLGGTKARQLSSTKTGE